MTSPQSQAPQKPNASVALQIALWVGQGILLGMFLMAGTTKLVGPEQFPFPLPFTYFLGVVEVLGAIGVFVPALLRIKPWLTPLAASGLATIMVLATGFHLSRGEPLVTTIVLGAIAIFVAWGRMKKAPIAPR